MGILELGRPARIGHIPFGASEGNFSVEKNLKVHFIDAEGNQVDGRLPAGTIAWEAQFRERNGNTNTGQNGQTFRYSWIDGKVSPDSAVNGYWSSYPNQSVGEFNISTFSDNINLYFASSANDKILEIRVWASYT